MKKVLILNLADNRPMYDQKQTYADGMNSLETQCDYTIEEFESLLFWYDGSTLSVMLGDSATDIATFDAVFLVSWFRAGILEDVALSVSLYLQSKGVPVVNSEALYTRSRSKLSQYVTAALNQITMTPFLFSLDSQVLKTAIRDRWGNDYPLIMKGAQASRGNDNYLVHSADDADQLLQSVNEKDGPWFILQSFIPNDGDYRIIVMGDSVTTVIHRQAQSETHLNNTSQGGTAELLDVNVLPQQVIDQSIKLSKLLRREVAGVDMIRHRETGQYYLLEINNMPQMATGSFVEQKLKSLDDYLAHL